MYFSNPLFSSLLHHPSRSTPFITQIMPSYPISLFPLIFLHPILKLINGSLLLLKYITNFLAWPQKPCIIRFLSTTLVSSKATLPITLCAHFTDLCHSPISSLLPYLCLECSTPHLSTGQPYIFLLQFTSSSQPFLKSQSNLIFPGFPLS